MTVYAGDRASPEVLARVQAALAPVCAALGGAGLHRLVTDLPPYGWRFEMRREQIRPAGVPSYVIATQGWPIRVNCYLRHDTATPDPVVWTEPGWSLAGLVVLVADLGPGADWAVKRPGPTRSAWRRQAGWDHMDLWPSLEAVSSTVLVGGYVGRLS